MIREHLKGDPKWWESILDIPIPSELLADCSHLRDLGQHHRVQKNYLAEPALVPDL